MVGIEAVGIGDQEGRGRHTTRRRGRRIEKVHTRYMNESNKEEDEDEQEGGRKEQRGGQRTRIGVGGWGRVSGGYSKWVGVKKARCREGGGKGWCVGSVALLECERVGCGDYCEWVGV